MHRRHQSINIPTEIVRTIVVISETGSFSKAGEKLGLSQPAISAQIKRLQILVGGAVFERVGGRVVLTELGKLVVSHARKLLQANDQLLSLGGATNEQRPIRLGLSTLYVEAFLKVWARRFDEPLSFLCEHSGELAKALVDGYLDLACLFNPPKEFGELPLEWQEDLVWVRSRDFVLGHGAPIPLVGLASAVTDQPMIQALERSGLTYRVAFASSDHHARRAAVAAGLGLMSLPKRQVAEPLIIANEYYLPTLGSIRVGVCVRSGLDLRNVEPIIAAFGALAPPKIAKQQTA